MSWFRHRPRAKIAPKTTPYRSSPIAEQQLKETVNKVRSLEDKDPKKK